MEEYYLGIDPSTKSTGYCVMNKAKDIIESGKIPMPDHLPEAEKILYQIEALEVLFDRYIFKKAVVEDQFGGINTDTLKKLSRVTGAILVMIARNGVPHELMYPAAWRKIFHGYGSAKKKTTFEKVCVLYEFSHLTYTKDNDQTDSIGICWACVDSCELEDNAA